MKTPEKAPQRIVSLVPSITELLCDLGLADKMVGITKFCVRPEACFREKTKVGGTKDFKVERVAALKPDLILANKEENDREGCLELMRHYPLWVSEVGNYAEALSMIETVGALTHRQAAAKEWMRKLAERQTQYRRPPSPIPCAYLIWKKPYMTVGGDTFIHDMLWQAGFQNVFGQQGRYPQTTVEALRNCPAECLLLSSEPFPFKQKHLEELQSQTGKPCFLVDGEMFSWYGSRMLAAWDYFDELLPKITSAFTVVLLLLNC